MSSKPLMSISRPTWVMSRSMRRKLPPVMRTMVPTSFTVGVEVGVVQAELLPIVREYCGDVFGVEWLVLVGEADPAVELGVAGRLPVGAGHADQDDAEVVAVEEVAELFETVGLEPVGLVDDEQFGAAGVLGVPLEFRVVVRSVQSFDVGGQPPDAALDFVEQLAGGDPDLRRCHCGAAGRQ